MQTKSEELRRRALAYAEKLTDKEDAKIREGIAADPDAAEWTDENFARARRGRGPQKAPTKVPVSLRLDQAVLEHFKASGPGWQSRINETLKKAVGM